MRRRGRLGYAGYAACLKTIVDGAGLATWRTVAEKNDVSKNTAVRLCHVLNDLRIIHVAGWVTPGENHRSRVAGYALGDLPDAPHPTNMPRKRANKRTESVELLTFAHAMRALQGDTHNGKSLAEAVGLYPRAARSLLAALHKARIIYIAEYQDRGEAGYGYPLYAFGLNKRDAKKPPPIPDSELIRAWNEVRKNRRAQAKLMHGIVTGANGDRRTSPYRNRQHQALPEQAV